MRQPIVRVDLRSTFDEHALPLRQHTGCVLSAQDYRLSPIYVNILLWSRHWIVRLLLSSVVAIPLLILSLFIIAWRSPRRRTIGVVERRRSVTTLRSSLSTCSPPPWPPSPFLPPPLNPKPFCTFRFNSLLFLPHVIYSVFLKFRSEAPLERLFFGFSRKSLIQFEFSRKRKSLWVEEQLLQRHSSNQF